MLGREAPDVVVDSKVFLGVGEVESCAVATDGDGLDFSIGADEGGRVEVVLGLGMVTGVPRRCGQLNPR